MKICALEHESFEDIGLIGAWITDHGYALKTVHLYQGDPLPDINEFDAFIIMGGSMGVYDEAKYPWLKQEKTFLKKAITSKKRLFGICLGAQLLALVMGSTVAKNKHKEIGWFPVYKTSSPSQYFFDAPEPFIVFQWHGDTFDIPRDAYTTFTSPICKNQAFESIDGRIIGLQFHIETQVSNIQRLIAHAPSELLPCPSVQTPDEMLGQLPDMDEHYTYLCQVLDRWALRSR